MTPEEHQDLIQSVESLLDYLKNDPKSIDLPNFWRIDIQTYVHEYGTLSDGTTDYSKVDEFETRLKMRQYAKALAPCEKRYTDHNFNLERMFGENIKMRLQTSRNAICERKVIEIKTIPAETITYPERTEEVVEWVCTDSLLAG